MAWLLDTGTAIHLRDGDAVVTRRIAALDGALLMSIVTRVELEGGVYWALAHAAIRRARLDTMLAAIPALAFDDAAADAYRGIVAHAGYSRRKLLDRMIAAQALVHRATFVTMNGTASATSPSCRSRHGVRRKAARTRATLFPGRHVVRAALARGDDVTIFTRGRTKPGRSGRSKRCSAGAMAM